MAGSLLITESPPTRATTDYDADLAKARRDIAVLGSLCRKEPRDLEKRVRLAYRQYHFASLTGLESDFVPLRQTIADTIRDFGPTEDVCLLQANVDGRFHRLAEVKEDLQMCPALSSRFAGRSVLADLDFQQGRYEQARAALEELIKENRTWDNLARLAYWKARMGLWDEANELYDQAEAELTAKEMRSFAWIRVQRGVIAMSRGRYAEAQAHYLRASRGYSGHWHVDEHWAELRAAEGDCDEAVTLLRGVIERVPKPELKQALGELFVFMGREQAAQPLFQEALAAYLESARQGGLHYYHHLADFYADAGGQPAEAVKWARKDIALRSNFSTQSALAWALYQNREIAEGLEWIRLAISSGVQDGGIFATASALFHAGGDAARGESYARAAAAINPHGDNFHLHH